MTDRSFRAEAASGRLHVGGLGLFRHAKLLLAGWLLAEVVLFSLVVREVGLAGAILLGILTSAIGVTTLRRLGRTAFSTLRTAVGGQAAPEGVLLDATLASLGAVLLILPGFVSDLVGLLLVTPSLRQTFVVRFGGRAPGPAAPRRNTQPGVIDLAPEEWSASEPAGR